MIRTVEAEIDENGNVRLLEPIPANVISCGARHNPGKQDRG